MASAVHPAKFVDRFGKPALKESPSLGSFSTGSYGLLVSCSSLSGIVGGVRNNPCVDFLVFTFDWVKLFGLHQENAGSLRAIT